jgi:Tol biopolymer transport system component
MTVMQTSAPAQPRSSVRWGLSAVVIGALVAAVAACGGSGSSRDNAARAARTAGSATKTASAASATRAGRTGSIVFRRFLRPDHTHGAIFTIAPDGTGERQVSRPGPAFGDDFPDFAADGSLIAFQRCSETGSEPCRIFTVRPDGTGLHAVGGCQGHDRRTHCADASYPALSPNGRRIAFVRGFGAFRDDEFDHQGIYTMRTDGSHPRRVTLPRSRTAKDGSPQWSSDGRRIVFVRLNLTAEPVDREAIFVVHADGSGLRRITPWNIDAGDGPVWSPDDSRILFRSPANDDFLNSNLYTIRPDGTDLKQVTHVAPTTRLYSSSFSPDGTSITFGMTGVDDAADLFTMHLDGTAATPVTRTPLHDSAPDWGGTP